MKKRYFCKISLLIIVLIVLAIIAIAFLFATIVKNEKTKFNNAEETTKVSQQEKNKSVENKLEKLAATHIYSHRGSEIKATEHTFDAYDWAIANGSKYIEQDLVLSADGTLYVSHDLTSTRLTGVSASYSNMTDNQIDELRTHDNQNILKLSDVFDRYGRSVNYVIELKSKENRTIEAFETIVDKYDFEDIIIAQCFQLDVLKALEEHYPNMLKLHLSRKDQWSFENALTKDYVDIVSVDSTMMSESNCKAAHEHGKKFCVYTIDSESSIRTAIEMGVDTYFTNDTELAMSLEKKYRENTDIK